MLDWLAHNPIADLPLPEFLLLYGMVIALTLAWCWVAVRQLDGTRGLPLPRIPESPDPYEIAYLRGGEQHVVRTAICALRERGYVRPPRQTSRSEQWLERTANTDVVPPTAIERAILTWLDVPRTVRGLYSAATHGDLIHQELTGYRERLRSARLLADPSAKEAARQVGIVAAAVVVGLGAYKVASLASGPVVGALPIVLMAGVALFLLPRVLRPPRLSNLGRRYLKSLELAFQSLRSQPKTLATAGDDMMLALLVGVYGIHVLAGTPHSDFGQMFPGEGTGDSLASAGVWSGGSGGGGGSDGGGSSSCGGGGGCGS